MCRFLVLAEWSRNDDRTDHGNRSAEKVVPKPLLHETVAGEYDFAGTQRSGPRHQSMLAGAVRRPLDHFAMAVQLCAMSVRGRCQPNTVPQRMQTECRPCDQSAELLSRVIESLTTFTGRVQISLQAQRVGEQIMVFLQPSIGPSSVSNFDFGAALRLKLNGLVARQLPDELNRGHLRCVIFPRIIEANKPHEFLAVHSGSARTAEAAVASGCTPAEMSRFKHPDIDVIVARQVQRRRKPGVTAADDRNITGLLCLQWSIVEATRFCRRLPVAGLWFVKPVQVVVKWPLHLISPADRAA